MTTVRIQETALSLSVVDGDVLTPPQMARIVAAVVAELERRTQRQLSLERDTRLAASRALDTPGVPGHDGNTR